MEVGKVSYRSLKYFYMKIDSEESEESEYSE